MSIRNAYKFSFLVAITFFGICIFFPLKVSAANRYWVGSAGGNTNSTANWSTAQNSCGVATGASVPSTTDTAFFTSSCTNGGNNSGWGFDETDPTTPGTPSTATPTNDTTPAWTWTASTDVGVGLTSPAYNLEWSMDLLFASGVSTSTSDTNSFTHSTDLSEDTWFFRVKATDNNGNESPFSPGGSVVIDTTAPSVVLTALTPDPTSDSTPTLTGTAADGDTVLTAIEFQIDLGPWVACTAGDGIIDELSETYSCTTGVLIDGLHTINIRATDSAANTTSGIGLGTDTFEVDTTAPSISLTALAPDLSSLPIGENPERINSILTPDGYKDISDVHIGDQVIGYDFENNITVTNTIEKIEIVNSSSYLDSLPKQDEDNSESEQTETSFTFYKINNDYELFRDQSVFANRELIHAENLVVGDTLFSDTNEAVTIDSIETISTHSEWIKLIVSGNHTYYSDEILLHNASRYWVGGGPTANWNATGSTNWGSISNTRNNASVPGTSDTAIFDGVGFGASNSTLSAAITINSLDMTGYVNTLTHNAVTLTISGNTFKLSPGMVYTLVNASTSAVSFTSTTGTSVSPTAITTAGKTLGNLTINGTNGYFSLQDDLTLSSTATLTFTAGTFSANDKNVTMGLFSSTNTNTRTLTMGTGIWTLTGNATTIWNTTTATGLTLNRGNDVVANYSGSTGTRTFGGTGSESTAVGFRITAGTDTLTTSSNALIHNLIFDGFTGTLSSSARTLFGNFIITPSSATMTIATSSKITTLAATSGTKLITTSGKTVDFLIDINGPGAIYQPTDNLTLGSMRSLYITAGTFQIPTTITLTADTITNNGTFTIDSGITTITANSFINNGTLTDNGSDLIMNLARHFINNGTVNISSGNWESTFSDPLGGYIATRTNMGATISTGSLNWLDGVIAPNGKIYGIPYTGTEILIIDPATGTATTSTMGANLTGSNKWFGGGLGLDGKIYGIPVSATDILIIDPVAGTATRSAMGANLTGTSKWFGGAVVAPNGKIYAPPGSAVDSLIIDPVAGTATRTTFGIGLPAGIKWYGGSLGVDGKIYGTAFGVNQIFIIDPATDTATYSDFGINLSVSGWFSSAAANNGKIYQLPAESSDIFVIDPVAGTAARNTFGLNLTDGTKWYGSVLGADGKIYGMPSASNDILVINPEANTAVRSTLGAHLSGFTKWYGGTIATNGVIYGMPASSPDILVLTPTVTGFHNYGTINDNGTDMSIGGDLFLYTGSNFTAPSGNLAVSGDFNHTDGSFSHNSGTVTLNGTNQTISGDTTFNDFSKTTSSSDTLTFESGSTQTILGTTSLTGTSGNLLYLVSSSPTTRWIFDPQGTRDIEYINVTDSNNINGTIIDITGNNITNGGNNLGWGFDETGVLISNVEAVATGSGAIITWDTSEESSSIVDYGLTNSYGESTTEEDTSPRVLEHEVNLSGLISCASYYYRVRSKDAANNVTSAGDSSFTTSDCTAASDIVSQTSDEVTTGSGGAISLLDVDSGITLDIPENFAGTDATFQIHKLVGDTVIAVTLTPTGFELAGDNVFELKALTDFNTSITVFDNAIGVTITYSDFDIAGLDESSLQIYRWDGSEWIELDNCIVDELNNSITCTTVNFSTFGLFGVSEEIEETEDRGSGSQRKRFIDIDNSIFKEYVLSLYNSGIIDGYPDGTFKPESYITRAELSKFIVNAFDLNTVIVAEKFSDVSETHSLYKYIYTLKQLGIIQGYPDGTFRPNKFVTRAEAAKFTVEALKLKQVPVLYNSESPFPDVSEDYTFYRYISFLYERNIINGYSDGTYKPEVFLTRGQMAKIIKNSIEII